MLPNMYVPLYTGCTLFHVGSFCTMSDMGESQGKVGVHISRMATALPPK